MWSDRKPQDLTKSNAVDNRAGRSPAESPNVAVIGKGMIIRGQIRSGEHIQVDGEIEGGLQLPGYDLTIGAGGRVRADVSAREVDVAGIIDGNVDATKKVTVRKGGRLLGDLRTPGIVIEDGAYFKGKIEIVNSETQETVSAATASTHTVQAPQDKKAVASV
jgi:cytoskeletal protein CcmA (bactofilin family)